MIGIYADFAPGTGHGHLSRSRAIAEALAARNLVFLARDAAQLEAFKALGLRTRRWSARLRCLLLIVDSYTTPPARWRALRRAAAALVIIDDLGRVPVDCEWVLNNGIAAGERNYGAARCRNFLLGPRFHPLRKSVRGAGRARRAISAQVRRVLVTLGGAPKSALVRRAVIAARAAFPRAELRVTAERPAGTPEARYLGARAAMRPLLNWADAALATGGQTLYELAHAGIPAVAFTVARNQRPNLAGFAAAGAVLSAGDAAAPAFSRRLSSQLKRLAGSTAVRKRLSAAGAQLIDGKGAARVARVLLEEVSQ